MKIATCLRLRASLTLYPQIIVPIRDCVHDIGHNRRAVGQRDRAALPSDNREDRRVPMRDGRPGVRATGLLCSDHGPLQYRPLLLLHIRRSAVTQPYMGDRRRHTTGKGGCGVI